VLLDWVRLLLGVRVGGSIYHKLGILHPPIIVFRRAGALFLARLGAQPAAIYVVAPEEYAEFNHRSE